MLDDAYRPVHGPRLEGQVAVITGGGRGQGRSHALACALEGADVVVCDIAHERIGSVTYGLASTDDLQETARIVEATGRRCLALTADVRDPEQVDAVFARAVDELGRVDVAIANAGISVSAEVAEMSDHVWRDVIDVNLHGVFHTVRAAARVMREQRSGRIICTGSTAARQGMLHQANYAASKWGLLGLVKSAALELAEYNITVNAVCPSATRTAMFFENEATYALFRPDLENPTTADIEEVILRDLHKLPVAWVEPRDVSAAVVHLAAESGRYVTGTGLDINCGLSGTWTA